MSVQRLKFKPAQSPYTHHVLVDELEDADLEILEKHSGERVLSLHYAPKKFQSLSFLESWKQLEDLRIYSCKFTDFSALKKTRKLKHVFINGLRYKDPDLSFLASIKSLESFSLINATHLVKFPDLSACKKLRALSVDSCSRLTDIGSVQKIKSLRSLCVYQVPQLAPEDFVSIMRMKGLTTLEVGFRRVAENTRFQELLESNRR